MQWFRLLLCGGLLVCSAGLLGANRSVPMAASYWKSIAQRATQRSEQLTPFVHEQSDTPLSDELNRATFCVIADNIAKVLVKVCQILPKVSALPGQITVAKECIVDNVESCCSVLFGHMGDGGVAGMSQTSELGDMISDLGSQLDVCCSVLSAKIDPIEPLIESCCSALSFQITMYEYEQGERIESCCSALSFQITMYEYEQGERIDSCCSVLGNKIDPIEPLIESCCSTLSGQLDTGSDALSSCCSRLETNLMPCTPIKQADLPLTISAPGVYCAVENLDYSGTDPAITISSDSVTVDLGRFTLKGEAGTAGNGIVRIDSATRVMVQNGKIAGGAGSLSGGVFITGSTDVTLQDLTVSEFRESGISADTTVHLVIKNVTASDNGNVATNAGFIFGAGVTDLEVSDSRAYANTGSGFLLEGTAVNPVERFVLRNNTASANTAQGFQVGGTSGGGVNARYGLLQHNVAIENSANGYLAGDESEFNTFKSNTALRNTSNGFDDEGTDNRFFNNCAIGNVGGDYADSGFFALGVHVIISPSAMDAPAGFWSNMKS